MPQEKENLITPDKLRERAMESIAAPSWLGRKERRIYERTQRHAQKSVTQLPPNLGISEVHQLQPIDQLLEEEDIVICKRELKDCEFVKVSEGLSFEFLRILRVLNIPDASIRAYYVGMVEGDMPQGGLTNLLLQAHPARLQQQKRSIINFETTRSKFLKSNNGRVVFHEDASQIFLDLVKLGDIPLEEIFREISRSTIEHMELLEMQIEWLQARQTGEDGFDGEVIAEEGQKVEHIKDEITPESTTQPPFSLSDWNLSWTTTHWSQDPNHLVTIPTTTREEALTRFTEVSRGEISVKPKSIFRALEFHMQKDVIQKALATRNKYGPVGIRDWVKIKRGRDRIFLLISEADNNAVFFAAGRDVVYRDI